MENWKGEGIQSTLSESVKIYWNVDREFYSNEVIIGLNKEKSQANACDSLKDQNNLKNVRNVGSNSFTNGVSGETPFHFVRITLTSFQVCGFAKKIFRIFFQSLKAQIIAFIACRSTLRVSPSEKQFYSFQIYTKSRMRRGVTETWFNYFARNDE